MSLDVYLEKMEPVDVYWRNITHNLTKMASEAGIYKHLWHPEELGITYARDLIEPIRAGIARLIAEPDRFKAFNPSNGWGSYEALLEFAQEYADACERHPEATVRTST